jgi:predicted chitinase
MGDITKAQQFSIESDGSFSKQKLTDVVGSSVGNLNKRAALEGMIDVEVGSTGPRTEDSYSLENLSNFTGTWRQRSINAGLLDQNGRPTKLAQDLNRQGQLGDTIFDVQYAGRNGNGDIESGDGSRFKGRGLVQLTGRGNYQAVQDILQAQGIDVDLINNPELVNDNRYALPAALAYLEHSGFTDEAADNMSARSLQLAINPSAPVETAEERWEAAITSLRVEDPEAADEMEKRNEYAAQRTVGTSVDGIIGDGSIRAMRGWLQENNITIPEDATNMDLVVLVNENA